MCWQWCAVFTLIFMRYFGHNVAFYIIGRERVRYPIMNGKKREKIYEPMSGFEDCFATITMNIMVVRRARSSCNKFYRMILCGCLEKAYWNYDDRLNFVEWKSTWANLWVEVGERGIFTGKIWALIRGNSPFSLLSISFEFSLQSQLDFWKELVNDRFIWGLSSFYGVGSIRKCMKGDIG